MTPTDITVLAHRQYEPGAVQTEYFADRISAPSEELEPRRRGWSSSEELEASSSIDLRTQRNASLANGALVPQRGRARPTWPGSRGTGGIAVLWSVTT